MYNRGHTKGSKYLYYHLYHPTFIEWGQYPNLMDHFLLGWSSNVAVYDIAVLYIRVYHETSLAYFARRPFFSE